MKTRPKKRARAAKDTRASQLARDLSAARLQASARRRAVQSAKETLRRARKAAKQAKKLAKEARKKFKELKRAVRAVAISAGKSKPAKSRVRPAKRTASKPASKLGQQKRPPAAASRLDRSAAAAIKPGETIPTFENQPLDLPPAAPSSPVTPPPPPEFGTESTARPWGK